MSVNSTMVRAMFSKGDKKRDAGLVTPENVVRADNIPYGTKDEKYQLLDLYRPKEAGDDVLPVIVSVHGGAWVYGDKDVYQFYCMNLAQRGFAVVNFSYRLAPESKHPAQLEDVNSVFHWVLDHAEEYHLDSNHVFAVGDSAGGHLLSLYCCLCTNPDLQKLYAIAPPKDFVPTAVGLNCGCYRFTGELVGTTKAMMADFLPEKGTPEELVSINVVQWVNSKFPPAFVMSAVEDFLLPEAREFPKVLSANGVRWKRCIYGNDTLKLGHVFHCNIRTKAAEKCNDDECAFFREYL